MAVTAGTDNQLWGPRFFALSGALLCALLPFSAYNALLSLIRAEWAMSNLQASSVYSAYLLGAALSALVLVPLSDRWPAARLWLVGLTVMCTAQLLFVVASPSPVARLEDERRGLASSVSWHSLNTARVPRSC